MFTIVRSPAKVCWHLMFDGKFFEAVDTKAKAEELKLKYEVTYGRLL